MINNKYPLGDIEEELDNDPILNMFFDNWTEIPYEEKIELLSPILGYVGKQYKYLGDIYDKDIDTFHRGGWDSPYPLYIIAALDEQYNYVGHVYLEGSNELIGIRSSLYNTMLRLYGRKHKGRISYVLFDIAMRFTREAGEKYLMLESPIGSGVIVAEKFGFRDGVIETGSEPKVEVPEYEILTFH